MTPQDQLNHALLYALREGCFFPVPEPSPDASLRDWIQWGAMRQLHDAMAAFFPRDDGVGRRGPRDGDCG